MTTNTESRNTAVQNPATAQGEYLTALRIYVHEELPAIEDDEITDDGLRAVAYNIWDSRLGRKTLADVSAEWLSYYVHWAGICGPSCEDESHDGTGIPESESGG